MAKLWSTRSTITAARQRSFTCRKKGIKGNTHFLMSDTNNEAIADILEDWMKQMAC